MKKVLYTIYLIMIVGLVGCIFPPKKQEQSEALRAEANSGYIQSPKNDPEFRVEQKEPELSEEEKESIQRFGHKYGLSNPKKLQPKKLQPMTTLEKLHQWVQYGLKEGVFHSVSPIRNEVRMDPILWKLLPDIETKRLWIKNFSQYFDLLDEDGIGGGVTIRSKYNDEKLGATGFWGGYKVYK